MQAFDIKKELICKTKEAAGLLKTINKAGAKMKTLIDQAKAAKQAQNEVEERADAAEAIVEVLKAEKKEAEAKIVESQAELLAALTTKDAEIKAADEKAYVDGAADVREEYKKQVKQACNKGFTLGWMIALNELAVPEDSTLRDNSLLVLPFPPTPSQSEDEAESEEDAEADKSEKVKAAGAKSPTLNEQVLDLTQDEGDKVQKTTSEAEVEAANKSVDDTLRQIDTEVEVDKSATPPADEANPST